MKSENHFQFAASKYLKGVTTLDANMSDFSYDKHAHEEYSIGVTLQGRQDFFSCRSFHKSSPGRIVLFNPDDVHDGHSGGDTNLKYSMLYLHPDALKTQFKALGIDENQTLRVEGTVLDDAILSHQILSFSELIQEENASKIEQESGLFQIARSLVRMSGQLQETTPDSRTDKLLIKAKEFIQANLHQDIAIDDIAAAANMSKFHFIRLFRSQFGITPHQYVLNCRINSARKALETGLPSIDVAQACGFADSSHLNRRFKRYFGMTPKQYQLQLSQ
ncbi:AraC family transcriptional regulator [Vibrio sp. JC009]|uniref:AraC family transcriptional regulator n=1 Tax=Vibrio sp. JC009 TaxID=2912314 RepID=UPI0023AF2F43|nr:AraC family transcriptional regulator [Vibrio sp. JC009]WED24535.1 AraC family transcriptional regulator [Vibrio sp. JC009]